MHVEFELPNEIAQALGVADLSRAALEAVAIEGYRSRRLGRGQVGHLLGFSTPMMTDEFLKQHDVPLNYTVEDFEQDTATLQRLFNQSGAGTKHSA